MINTERNWDILLIGGASGTGKTSVSCPLARFYNIDLVRVDDFQVLLKAMTTPDGLPSIHYWRTHPDWQSEGVDATVSQLIDVGRAMIPGLEAVIEDHIVENIPMILEGDFILPELCASMTHPRVKSIFIIEPSKEQILQNYLDREGSFQEYRAAVSYSYSNWLQDSCSNLGIPVVTSRPWHDLLERVIASIKSSGG
jgi:2-phosphoglycerate kinase